MAETKTATIKRSFRHESSSELAPRAGLDVTAIIFSFFDGENKVDELEFNLASAFGGTLPAPGVGRAAAAFGINTSAGNAGNTVKGEDGEKPTVVDRVLAVKERLETFQEGQWEAERESSGPRTTMVAEAIKLALQRKGLPHDEAAMKPHLDRLANEKEAKMGYLAKPLIKLAYEDIRDEKRKQKRAQLEAAAGASTLDI